MKEDEDKQEEEEGVDWEEFKAFTQSILSVPKEELDRREREGEARKKGRKPDSS